MANVIIRGYRFTPTCVGTTGWAVRPRSALAVHPHVRGDNTNPWRLKPDNCGSPPRAWGQLAQAQAQAAVGRFTPTCVGTT